MRFLDRVQDDHLAPTPFPATQTDLATRLSHQVGLGNHAIGTLRNLADNLDPIDPLVVGWLWQSDHRRYLVKDTIEFVLEVIMVVDDTQMGMAGPGTNHLLIQFTRNTQSLLISLFVTGSVGGCRIVLFCAVGSTWCQPSP